MINATIFGATGYAGAELVRLLSGHKHVFLRCLVSRNSVSEQYADIYSGFNHFIDLRCSDEDIAAAAEESDVLFLSMPHGVAADKVSKNILAKTKVIDIGPDFRINDPAVYETWYQHPAPSLEILREAIYGLTELYRDNIQTARIVANPGCYTTCSILALYPLLKENAINIDGIVIDAKSGVSGAGRQPSVGSMYCECNDSIKAYKVAAHRHTPEIEEKLSEAAGADIKLVFTPHLTPMNRGILSTIYTKPKQGIEYGDIAKIYAKYYESEYFIRILKPDKLPETRWTRGSNFCDIGFKLDTRTNTLVILAALDNLVKGAAGQAIQNMNLMFGLPEKTALDNVPLFI